MQICWTAFLFNCLYFAVISQAIHFTIIVTEVQIKERTERHDGFRSLINL